MSTTDPLNATDRELSLLIRAKYPLLLISTSEEWRVLEKLELIRADVIQQRLAAIDEQLEGPMPDQRRQEVCEQRDRLRAGEAHPIIRWAYGSLSVWCHYQQGERQPPRELSLPGSHTQQPGINPLDLLLTLRKDPDAQTLDGVDVHSALFVFCDLHPWLDREDPSGHYNHMVVRTLRDLAYQFKRCREPKNLVLLAPKTVAPLELNKELHIIDYPLPSVDELRQQFDADREEICARWNGSQTIDLSEQQTGELMRSLSGLTSDEAGNVLAKSLNRRKKIDSQTIHEAHAEKRQIIRKDGILEYMEPETDLQDVGGLEVLIRWLEQRRLGFPEGSVTVEHDGQKTDVALPVPKGVLLVGIPGAGKSLIAKAVAAAWRMPLLKMDVGRIYAGFVGQSEENMRRAIRVAESVAPVCIWLDECEKAFPRTTGSLDAGVSLRVMNTFLTWLQEKKHPVFVVATANDIAQMPTELTRKGRFDEIFYVGLPDAAARRRILEIHVRAHARLTLPNADLDQLAERCRYFTGAEIEQAVKNAMYLVPSLEWLSPLLESYDHPFARCLAWCMDPKHFVPLARRRDREGRLVLEETLKQADAIAIRASAQFEPLPDDQGPVTPRQASLPPGRVGTPAPGARY